MRIGLLVVCGSALGGCWSQWELRDAVPTQACLEVHARPWFQDADGDGWGDPDGPTSMQCLADLETGFTTRNRRDCDSADPSVTGRTATLCPGDLAHAWVGLVTQEREYLAVLPPTPTAWAGAAEGLCGPVGWGGGLATFDRLDDVEALQSLLAEQPVYAAFLGIQSDGVAWRWIDDAAMPLGQLPACTRLPDPTQADETARLALVKRGEGDWCLGLPHEVKAPYGLPEPRYTEHVGHFLCARPKVDPLPYAEPRRHDP